MYIGILLLYCCFRLLDISQEFIDNGIFSSPNSTLEEIVTSLPELTHLDISGTNLPGNGHFLKEDIKVRC